MAEESIEQSGLIQRGERLISFADAYTDDELWMQEFIADHKGGYRFMDCTAVEGIHQGARYLHKVFYSPLEALKAWNEQTGQSVTQAQLFRGMAAS